QKFAGLRKTNDAVAVLLRDARARPVSIGDDQVSVGRDCTSRGTEECVAARFRHTRLAQGLEQLPILIELEHLIAAARRSRGIGERAAVASPEISVAILAESVRLYEHAIAERLQNVSRGVEMNDRRLRPVVQPRSAFAIRDDAD